MSGHVNEKYWSDPMVLLYKVELLKGGPSNALSLSEVAMGANSLVWLAACSLGEDVRNVFWLSKN